MLPQCCFGPVLLTYRPSLRHFAYSPSRSISCMSFHSDTCLVAKHKRRRSLLAASGRQRSTLIMCDFCLYVCFSHCVSFVSGASLLANSQATAGEESHLSLLWRFLPSFLFCTSCDSALLSLCLEKQRVLVLCGTLIESSKSNVIVAASVLLHEKPFITLTHGGTDSTTPATVALACAFLLPLYRRQPAKVAQVLCSLDKHCDAHKSRLC